jgi:hypothetical protein
VCAGYNYGTGYTSGYSYNYAGGSSYNYIPPLNYKAINPKNKTLATFRVLLDPRTTRPGDRLTVR